MIRYLINLKNLLLNTQIDSAAKKIIMKLRMLWKTLLEIMLIYILQNVMNNNK